MVVIPWFFFVIKDFVDLWRILKKTWNSGGKEMDITYEQFKAHILKITGVDLNNYKEKQMKRRIESFISRQGKNSMKDYLVHLESNLNHRKEFLDYITINVTEFFRNPGQWQVLEEAILPELFKFVPSRRLKIWSSACSTGEEPYSLAMLMSKFLPMEQIKILASDIDTTVMDKAKEGIYSLKSLANLPNEMITKHFDIIGEKAIIKQKIKETVEFKRLNLLSDDYPSNCDLILCRNVMIYFTEETKVELYNKFKQSLNKYGVFFVGSTEQIILSHRYGLTPAKTFFYKKID